MSESRKWTKEETEWLKENYQRMTYEAAGKKLNRSFDSVRQKCYRLGLRKQPQTIVDKDPSPSIAYVLGFCLGDGHVEKEYSYSIILECIDKDFVVSFSESLKEVGLRPYSVHQTKKETWRVSAKSKDFSEWYHRLDMQDVFDLLTTTEIKKEFIRGFYESEGSLNMISVDSWKARMGICDLGLLEFVEKVINELGFETAIYEGIVEGFNGPTTEYTLHVLGGTTETIKFLEETNPRISRKSIEKIDTAMREA